MPASSRLGEASAEAVALPNAQEMRQTLQKAQEITQVISEAGALVRASSLIS